MRDCPSPLGVPLWLGGLLHIASKNSNLKGIWRTGRRVWRREGAHGHMGGLPEQCAHGPPNTRILPCYEIEPKLHKWGEPDLESFGVCVLVPLKDYSGSVLKSGQYLTWHL